MPFASLWLALNGERERSSSSTTLPIDRTGGPPTTRRSTPQSSTTEGHSCLECEHRSRWQGVSHSVCHSHYPDSPTSLSDNLNTTDEETEKYELSSTSSDDLSGSKEKTNGSILHEKAAFDGEKDMTKSSRNNLVTGSTFKSETATGEMELQRKRLSKWDTDTNILRENPVASEIDDSMPPVPPDLGKWHEYLFVFSICMAQLLSLAALAQSFAPLLIISASFGETDPGQMSWYTAAYSMTLGTFILPAGRLGDMFGHKRMFLGGWVWFGFWSMICGFSYVGGPIMLSTCRGLQGIGPALLVPNGIALLGRRFPIGMKRALSIAIFGGCGPVGVTLGVVFSSLFAQLVWWPWSFWAMAITCAFSGILAYIVIPTDALQMQESTSLPREQFDYLGAVTGVTGLLLINFALNEAPVEGWDHVYIPVLLVLGFILMAAFVYVELKVATRPIVPLRGLHREAAFTLACVAAGWCSHGIWSYYMYLFIEGIRGHSPLVAAAETSPVALIGFCAAIAVPFILKKLMSVATLMSVAMLAFALCIVLLLTAPIGQTYWINTFLSILIAPFAMNWSFPSGTILMSNAVPKHHQGIAASLIATMVNYSIATGLGIGGTIARYKTPEHGVIGAYRDVWWLGVAFALTGFIISLYFIWQTRTKKPGPPPG